MKAYCTCFLCCFCYYMLLMTDWWINDTPASHTMSFIQQQKRPSVDQYRNVICHIAYTFRHTRKRFSGTTKFTRSKLMWRSQTTQMHKCICWIQIDFTISIKNQKLFLTKFHIYIDMYLVPCTNMISISAVIRQNETKFSRKITQYFHFIATSNVLYRYYYVVGLLLYFRWKKSIIEIGC